MNTYRVMKTRYTTDSRGYRHCTETRRYYRGNREIIVVVTVY